MNHRLRALLAVPAIASLALVAGCHGNSDQSGLTPAQKEALAPYEAAVQKDVTQVGGPVALLHKSARHDLYAKLEALVPRAKRDAFVNSAVNDALKGHLYRHSGRVTFIDVTLPSLLKQDGAHLS